MKEDNFSIRINRAHTRLAVLERLMRLESCNVAEGVPNPPGFPMEYHEGVHQLVREIMLEIRVWVDWSPKEEPSEKWLQEVLEEALKNEEEARFGYTSEPTQPEGA